MGGVILGERVLTRKGVGTKRTEMEEGDGRGDFSVFVIAAPFE